MKRFSSLTAAASLAGLVMVSSGPALAFDSDAIPPMLVASPTLPLSACLYAEKAGYPNPGGDGCSYLDVGPPYYYNMWNQRLLCQAGVWRLARWGRGARPQ